MPTGPLKVVHVSPRVQARGGIETLHGYHRGLAGHSFVALIDRRPEGRPGYINLNFNWRTTLGRMRREFARAMEPHRGAVVIYHNAWCLPLLAGLDGAARRIAFCHASPAFHARDLPGSRGLVDGAIGLTGEVVRQLPALVPELGPERALRLPLPADLPPVAVPEKFPARKLVLGYAGRVVREQKRMDRLPEFIRELDRLGMACEFEVLGDGPLLAGLEGKLVGRVRFHGWMDRQRYAEAMARWDAAVYFTENEGGPIALLEAMSVGALPVYPQIGGSQGDEYAPKVDPRCHYPAGDLRAAARAVRDLFAEPAERIACCRARSRELAAGHTEENYIGGLNAAIEKVAALPRVSAAADRHPAHWSDVLPLGLVTRTMPGLLYRRR